jgi:hypothetical protein
VSLTGGHLDALLEAGATAEQIVALVKADMAERERALEEKRAKDAERQRRHRSSRDVTVTACDTATKGFPEVSPHTPLPNQSQISPLNPPRIGEVQERWNAMAGKHGLPRVEAIKGKRLRAVKARAGEHDWDAVMRAIDAVPGSPHWLGANGWLGNFDSLMRPENFQRMLEGTYATKGSKPQVVLTAADYRDRAEWYDRHQMRDSAAECRRLAAQLEQGIAA